MPKSVTLRKYFTELRKADLRYAQARFDAQEKAIALASGRAQIVSIIGIIIAIISVVVSIIVTYHK